MTASSTQDSGPRFFVKGQYIKDVSFENPHAPNSLFSVKEKPSIDVTVDIKADRMQEDLFETTLILSCHAKADGNTLFLIELSYSGIFQLQNIPVAQVDRLLFVEAPSIMFPFARRIVSDLSRDGGFPPLMLEPIDFHALYLNRARTPQTASA
jgi:preprotein translocase subunit SecB